MKKEYSDKELIEGILAGDNQIICYFLFEICTPVLNYIIRNTFHYKVQYNELVNELYVYLQDNDWDKIRKFDFRCKLTSWLSLVATRFFHKKRVALLVKELPETDIEIASDCFEQQLEKNLEVDALLELLPNERYRFVLQELFLKDREPLDLANEMGITVDNLYNIKRRALEQLRQTIKKLGGYGR